MTEIKVNKTLLGRHISVVGHADRAGDMTKGNLICAALSILTQTMAENLLAAEDEGRADIITLDLKSGEADMEYITDDESVNSAFDAGVTGFALLAERYPETVSLWASYEPEVQGSVDLCRFDGETAQTAVDTGVANVQQTLPELPQDGAQRFRERLHDLKVTNERRQSRIMDAVASRYGVRRGDITALEKAVSREENDGRLENLLSRWSGQEQAVKELYPDFELKAALGDRSFFGLLYKGLDVRTAYEVVHRDELLRAAMEYAAETARRMAAEEYSRRGIRAREGALSDTETVRDKPATLTKKQRGELIRRAERGERIKL
ncbi:MAG: ribosomal-processing cysteine protease Prp [Eubacterium sp.]|nr:ribosomal-processing cysteine protease Prp [Eubacterium sp.]